MIIAKEHNNKKIRCADEIVGIFQAVLQSEHEIDQDKEHLWVVGFDTKNYIKYIELVSLGILDKNLVHPRETFRLAIIQGVLSIVIAHNHPSGNPAPSENDIDITRRLKSSADILGLTLLDHIIIGKEKHFSFADSLLLKEENHDIHSHRGIKDEQY